jgi:hypothetical protein
MASEYTSKYPGKGTVKYDDRGRGVAGIVPDLQVRSVVAVFDHTSDVDDAVRALQQEGYQAEDISVVRRGEGTPPQLSADNSHADKGTIAGAGVGAVIGGAIGLTALAATGIGALLAAGPLLAALSGALTGGAVGALAGSMAGLGVPTDEAERYEEAVRSGGVLVAVKAENGERAQAISRLMTERGARDVNDFAPAL